MGNVRIITNNTQKGKTYTYKFEIAKVDGKRQWESGTYPTMAEAKRAGNEAKRLYDTQGRITKCKDLSFADFLDIWIENDCVPYLKASTVKGYQKRIRNQIKPALGAYRLLGLNRQILQEYILNLFDSGVSPNSISCIKGILTKSMGYAVDNAYLPYSPADKLKTPKNRAPRRAPATSKRTVISREVMGEILRRFPEGTPSHIPLRLAYECGFRIGEVFALTWDDIDFERKQITVNRQVQWEPDATKTISEKVKQNGKRETAGGYWYFSNPKYDSVRVVDVSEDIIELLGREKKRQEVMAEYYGEFFAEYHTKKPIQTGCKIDPDYSNNRIYDGAGGSPVRFLLVRENGTYISSRTMQHTTRVIQRDIYKDFNFHSLRHTHASILYGAGLESKYISDRLGHTNTEITEGTYIHTTDELLAKGRETLNTLFGKNGG